MPPGPMSDGTHSKTIRLFQLHSSAKSGFTQFELDSCRPSTTVGEIRHRIAKKWRTPVSLVCLWLQHHDEEGKLNQTILRDDDSDIGPEQFVYSLVKRLSSTSWQRGLEDKGLEYYRSGGDGNCQFRSISKLVYGTENCHETVRQCCMDYMVEQRHHFENVCVSELHRSGFEEYIRAKSKTDGSLSSYGDEPELQAMSEMYRRVIEVWTFVEGAWCVLRTYQPHEPVLRQPLRVCYLGRYHYDALLPRCAEPEVDGSTHKEWVNGQLEPRFAGQWEAAVLKLIQQRTPEELEAIRQARAVMRENLKRLEEEIPDAVLNASLAQLEEEAKRELEQAVQESIEDENSKELQEALEASQKQAEEEFEEAKRQSRELEERIEKERLKKVIDVSLDDHDAIKKAKQESIIEQLRQWGYARYEAEVAAANASDVESALQELEKLTSSPMHGELSKKQIIEELMKMSYPRYLAEYGAENAVDTDSAIDAIANMPR